MWKEALLIPKGGWGLLRHRPSGGVVEGGDGDSQSTIHGLHHLSRRPPWFLGG